MKIDLQQYNQKTKAERKENTRYFKQLKGVKSKALDERFHKLHKKVFAETDCLTCANCCKTTGPLFTRSDINRLAKHLGQKPSDFIDEYLIRDEDEDFVLKTTPCSFLEEDNRCSVYEVRPKACREYPHTDQVKMHQILELTRKNSEVCPAVGEIMDRMKANY